MTHFKEILDAINERKRISLDYLSKYHFEYVPSQHKYDKHKMIYIQPKDEKYDTFRVIQTINGEITSESEEDFRSVQEIISKDFKERGHKIKHFDLLEKYGFHI